MGKRSLWTGGDGDAARGAAAAVEDGGDVDVEAAGGDRTEGDVPMASILARSLWNQASWVRDSPMITGEGRDEKMQSDRG